jgi:hypothetical protein
MRPLAASELLEAWEHGLVRRWDERAMELLRSASPETSPDHLASLSIGLRDAALLTLREWSFGQVMTAVIACPACREQLEFILNVNDLRVSGETEPESVMTLKTDHCDFRFRSPNSLDLAAIASHTSIASATRELFERCLLEAHQNGEAVSAGNLPEAALEAVAKHLAEANPQADVQVGLLCPACEHRWSAIFDIASYFWTEIDAWARRLLGEVHTLASCYGWHERDILALSPSRRQLYLEMLGG